MFLESASGDAQSAFLFPDMTLLGTWDDTLRLDEYYMDPAQELLLDTPLVCVTLPQKFGFDSDHAPGYSHPLLFPFRSYLIGRIAESLRALKTCVYFVQD